MLLHGPPRLPTVGRHFNADRVWVALERQPFSGLVHSAGECYTLLSGFDFHGHRPAVLDN